MLSKDQILKYATSEVVVTELSFFSINLRNQLSLRKTAARAMLAYQTESVKDGLEKTIDLCNQNLRKLLDL